VLRALAYDVRERADAATLRGHVLALTKAAHSIVDGVFSAVRS
jgi:hypothetical protein